MTAVARRKTYSADLLTAYKDADGNIQQVSPRTIGILRKLLSASATDASRHLVVSAGDALDPADISEKCSNTSPWQLVRDGLAVVSGEAGPVITIPVELPPGGYTLRIGRDATEAVPVLVAPREAYQPAFARRHQKTWLLGVQLYALATPDNWGHGDFSDLLRILEICAHSGCGGVGLNPIHALFEQRPEDASPYAPSSRLFINPLYLDLSRLPGYSSELERMADNLPRNAELVDYASVARTKYAVLRETYRRFLATADTALTGAFADFRRRKGNVLRRFAAFNLLQARYGLDWRQWSAEWQTPDDERIAELGRREPEAIGAEEFAQWQSHTQLAACRDYARRQAMPVGLYLDVAVGSHPHGFDAWNDQEAFLRGVTIGAPPDAMNAAGQNWGLTAFNPLVLIRRGFRPLRDILAAAMEFAGAIRVDHILGLNRFYLIPDGGSGRDGAYLRYPLRELLAVLALESQQWRCLVIGEDLGTVPQGFREQLQAAGIWTYIVTLFERDAAGAFRDTAGYPYRALATFTTHDLPPFAAWAEGKDLEMLRALGLPAGESAEQRRVTYNALLNDARSDSAHTPFERTIALLGGSGSAIIAVALEDIYGQKKQLNVPGTYDEYPNWRHRTAVAWPDFKARMGRVSEILQAYNR